MYAAASMVPRSQITKQSCLDEAASSKKVVSIAIIVLSKFSWNLSAAIDCVSSQARDQKQEMKV